MCYLAKKNHIIGGGKVFDYIERLTRYKKYSQSDFPDICGCRKGHICSVCNEIIKRDKNYHRKKNRIAREINEQLAK